MLRTRAAHHNTEILVVASGEDPASAVHEGCDCLELRIGDGRGPAFHCEHPDLVVGGEVVRVESEALDVGSRGTDRRGRPTVGLRDGESDIGARAHRQDVEELRQPEVGVGERAPAVGHHQDADRAGPKKDRIQQRALLRAIGLPPAALPIERGPESRPRDSAKMPHTASERRNRRRGHTYVWSSLRPASAMGIVFTRT
jgi:hypothetical protein